MHLPTNAIAPLFLVAYAVFSQVALAEEIEEVIVTGSFIKGSPEDAASPVDVTTREELELTGSPSIVDLIKRTPSITGVDGETNPFQSNGLQGIANVNLRGLGPGRTLTLFNGHRMAPSPRAISETGQQFVNVNAIPTIAIGRVELLTDGASSTYGSDAVAGVVNFITRSDFRGVEFQTSYTDVPDSEDDGNYDLGFIVGFGTERLDIIASIGYQYRTEVKARNKSFTLPNLATNPRGGFSGIGSPGTYFSLDFSQRVPDPDCETVGGVLDGTTCRFRFQDFFNLAEEEEHLQTFVEASFAVNDTLNLTAEFLYSEDDVDNQSTSPSFPPQALFGTDRLLVPGTPHFDDFLDRNPQLTGTAIENGAFILGRFQGVSGPSQTGPRNYETTRIRFGANGSLFDGSIDFDASITYGNSELSISTTDTRIDRAAWAYRGLGGVNCNRGAILDGDPSNDPTPGAGDCFYYNPLTSGYAVSQSRTTQQVAPPGSENTALLNSPEVLSYLTGEVGGTSETELYVYELVFSGESGITAAGGDIGWALGFQYRDEEFSNDAFPESDIAVTACAFGLDNVGDSFTIPEIDLGGGNAFPAYTYTCEGTGAFHFLAAGTSDSQEQDVLAVFGEIRVPFTDNLEMQAAIRYEDYGGDVGNTIDPKIALRWTINDVVTLRGSLTTSFRAPSLNQLEGVSTSLQFVSATSAFKAVDTFGNAEISPETAITSNFGILLTPTENISLSFDFWNFEFSDTLVLESFSTVISDCFDPMSSTSEEACTKITFQDSANPTAGGVQRIGVTYQNGPDLTTNGVDWHMSWDIPTEVGDFTLGATGTFINAYRIDASTFVTSESFDAVGDLNRFDSVARPLPDIKNNFFVNWAWEGHNVRLEHWYTAEYDDRSQPEGLDWSIDSHTTFDIHYNYRFRDDNARIFVSITNIGDEDPPFARLDLQYDPYTHNAFGRLIKVGLQWKFQGGPFQ